MKKNQQALVQLIQTLPIKTKIRTIEDLFNGITLCEFMRAVYYLHQQSRLDEQTAQHLGLDYLTTHPPPTPTRFDYFSLLLSALRQYSQQHSTPFDLDIQLLAYQSDLSELSRLVMHMFMLLTSRRELVGFMTRLTNESQLTLMELIKQSQNITGKTRQTMLLEDIEKLEGQVMELQEIKLKGEEERRVLEEERRRLEGLVERLMEEIDVGKRTSWNMEELEETLSFKEREIELLTAKNQQLSADLHHSQQLLKQSLNLYTKDLDRLKQQLEQSEKLLQKSENRIAELQLALRKSDGDDRLHTLVNSLEKRCQEMGDKIQMCEKENQGLMRELEEREEVVGRGKERIQQLEGYVQELEEQRDAYMNNVQSKVATPRYLDASLKDKQPSELGECHRNQCLRRRHQLQTFKKKYLQLLSHTQTPYKDYVTECHRIIDQKSKIIQQYRDKLAKTTSDNIRLKQQRVYNPTGHVYEAKIAKLQGKIQRNEQKNQVLKKKVEELQGERNSYQGSLGEVRQMYAELVGIVRKCHLCARVVRGV